MINVIPPDSEIIERLEDMLLRASILLADDSRAEAKEFLFEVRSHLTGGAPCSQGE